MKINKTPMYIPVIFAWLHFHREEQLLYCKQPILVIHFRIAQWLEPYFVLYSKRLICIGKTLNTEEES